MVCGRPGGCRRSVVVSEIRVTHSDQVDEPSTLGVLAQCSDNRFCGSHAIVSTRYDSLSQGVPLPVGYRFRVFPNRWSYLGSRFWAWNTTPVSMALRTTMGGPWVVNPPIAATPRRGQLLSAPAGYDSAATMSFLGNRFRAESRISVTPKGSVKKRRPPATR